MYYLTMPEGPFKLHDSYWRNDYNGSLPRAQIRRTFEFQRTHDFRPSCSVQPRNTLYLRSPVKDLRELLNRRNIPIPPELPKGHDLKRNLELLLDVADITIPFHPFLRLPAELRNRVYAEYVNDFANKPLNAPTNPPLSLANRQLRTEFLPVFFGNCTFDLRLIEKARDNELKDVSLRMELQSQAFFNSVDLQNLSTIRNLRLCLSGPRNYCISQGTEHMSKFTIQLSDDHRSFNIVSKAPRSLEKHLREPTQQWMAQAAAQLRQVLEAMRTAHGQQKIVLTLSSIYALRRALEVMY